MELFVISSLESDSRKGGIAEKAVIAVVDHILENDHSKPVAIIIKLLRFNFYMFAKGVESKGFCRKDIFFVTGRGCGS